MSGDEMYPGYLDDVALLERVLDESRERAERIRSDHALADLARAFCAAWQSNKDAEPCDWERARAEIDRTFHDLLLACGYEDQE